MNFVNLSDLYWQISAQAPGLNKATALDHLRESAREFCDYTLAIQETIEDSISIGDDQLIVRPSSAQLELKLVMRVETPRGPLKVETLERLQSITNWRAKIGNVCGYVEEGDIGELRLYPISDKAEDVHVRIAVVPSLNATKIPKALAVRYGTAIKDGALARILGMPNQTWTNPGAAMKHQRDFDIARSGARATANLDNGRTTLTRRIQRQF